MRATLIHNPSAGDEQPSAADLKEILKAAGFQVRYQSTKKNWKKALQEPADLVIVAGGDGTLGKVFKELCGTEVPVCPLPIGTANNIARSLGIVGDAQAIIAATKTGRTQPFDLGRVRFGSGDEGTTELFVEACGGGLFAAVVDRGRDAIEDPSALLGTEADRALALLRRLVDEVRPAHWGIEIDGRDVSGDYLAVEVMNVRLAGPSVPLAPRAKTGDGRLEVALVRERDRQALNEYLSGRLAHDGVEMPDLDVVGGRRVILRPPDGTLRIDDEVHADIDGRAEISIIPGAVRLLGAPPRRSGGRNGPAPGRASGGSRTPRRT